MALVRFMGWVCCACRFTVQSSLNKLKQTVADLTREVKLLRSSFPLAVTGRSTLVHTVDSTATEVSVLSAATELQQQSSLTVDQVLLPMCNV